MNLNPAVQKPRMTPMGTGFVMVENLFRGHPPGEHSLPRNSFFISARSMPKAWRSRPDGYSNNTVQEPMIASSKLLHAFQP
jgi:hypothetical protein